MRHEFGNVEGAAAAACDDGGAEGEVGELLGDGGVGEIGEGGKGGGERGFGEDGRVSGDESGINSVAELVAELDEVRLDRGLDISAAPFLDVEGSVLGFPERLDGR